MSLGRRPRASPAFLRRFTTTGGSIRSRTAAFFSRGSQRPASWFAADGPEHWEVVFEKITYAWENFEIPRERLSRISAPTLVMAGDDDAIKVEHTVDMYEAIPGSELAIVPGTSHLVLLEKSELANKIVLDFLRNDPLPTLMPIRRATS